MSFKYWLPDEQGNKIEKTTDSNAVIIIGANGSGKSKLGAWIERKDMNSVHRIGAQRKLSFPENIPLMTYSQASNLVYYGIDDKSFMQRGSKVYRWGGNDADYTTRMIEDIDNVFAELLAINNNEEHAFVEAARKAEANNDKVPSVPITISEKLIRIWKRVLPQRQIVLDDSKFIAEFDNNGTEVRYPATNMSDGERSVLYLAAQVLCVPENKILIIDEPEVHLHRSIMNRLWEALEDERPDCLFIYITHDIQFAAAHSHADKIWVREYDGKVWKYEKIESGDLPEEMLLDILGSRKKVLFVEGERNSYDTQLYSEIYPDHYVVPCGSCTQVIARTKAFRGNPSLHENEVYGIIDRDFRSDYEIEQYKGNGIYTIGVAEVENLFIVEELVRLIASQMALSPDDVFDNVKNYVVNDRFANQIEGQICESVVAQIKYKLSSAEISKKSEAEAKATLDNVLSSIDFDSIKRAEEDRFRDALSNGDYREILKQFNRKSLVGSIGHFLGLQNSEYCQMVLRLLHGVKHDEIINALLPYMPVEIPRT
ncbi:MAG: DUF4435 domain-containing protein [Clostridia bacterium]|nr:DUF4435 domain-containing protein [Clostridia bacterium]